MVTVQQMVFYFWESSECFSQKRTHWDDNGNYKNPELKKIEGTLSQIEQGFVVADEIVNNVDNKFRELLTQLSNTRKKLEQIQIKLKWDLNKSRNYSMKGMFL